MRDTMLTDMNIVKKILYYLNPFNRLGKKQYTIVFPFLLTLLSAFILEFYVIEIVKNPQLVRVPAVIIFLGLIIYFSFHDGLRGGMTATCVTILYYIYLLATRYSTTEKFVVDIETVVALGLLYIILTAVVGGLKQRTDVLIEREANEKKWLQTILQQMPIGVIVTDKNGKVTHTNKQLEQIMGNRIPVGSILGKHKALMPETYNIHVPHPPLAQVLKAGKSIIKQEYLIQRKDGKKRYIQLSASPIFGKNNQIVAASATIIDITQQKELEKRKDDFVNIASHELKTPITSMKLYLGSLENSLKTYKDTKAKKTLRNISHQTDRLQELVSDLLDVSRLQTGKLKFLKENFRLDTLIENTIESLQGTTKHQKIIFSKKQAITIYADKFRIEQVITNLITNAVKYSPPNTDILITLQKEKTKAIVDIKDLGIGIIKEQQKRIFDRLYQVSEPKEKTFPGLGIGLFICKQIIKRHKGTIWVESEKGKGSTFSFSLPLSVKN